MNNGLSVLPEFAFLNLILSLGLWLLLPSLSPYRKSWRLFVLIPLIIVQINYLWWRLSSTINPFDWSYPTLWQYLYFITEAVVVAYTIWQCITLLNHIDRSAECDQMLLANGSLKPSVDLYIPTHSESRKILSATIAAAKQDHYPNLRIWICDDGARSWLRQLCIEQGVGYLSDPRNLEQRNKATNLNWCMYQGSADYIVCLDADFQAMPNFTTRLTSFLANPKIGLVQVPQHFRNLDAVQRNLTGGKAWTEEQRFFFDVSLPSRDAWGNALCVGSGWATRRKVLNQMQGFPTDSVVEDVYFGYMIKSLGYSTVYLNEVLATGLAAEDTISYVNQRNRWCRGAIELFSAPHGPIRAKNLSFKDRVFYADIPIYWLTHFHVLMLLLAPIAYGFYGFTVFSCTTTELLSILVPKNILLCAIFYWVSEGRCMPVITPVQKILTLFHVIPSIFKGILKPGSASFEVTQKDINYEKRVIHWRLAAPFIVMGCLTVLAMAMTLSQSVNYFDWSDYSAYNVLLSAYSLVAILLCCLICVERPTSSEGVEEATPLHGSWRKTSVALSRRIFS